MHAPQAEQKVKHPLVLEPKYLGGPHLRLESTSTMGSVLEGGINPSSVYKPQRSPILQEARGKAWKVIIAPFA